MIFAKNIIFSDQLRVKDFWGVGLRGNEASRVIEDERSKNFSKIWNISECYLNL